MGNIIIPHFASEETEVQIVSISYAISLFQLLGDREGSGVQLFCTTWPLIELISLCVTSSDTPKTRFLNFLKGGH